MAAACNDVPIFDGAQMQSLKLCTTTVSEGPDCFTASMMHSAGNIVAAANGLPMLLRCYLRHWLVVRKAI